MTAAKHEPERTKGPEQPKGRKAYGQDDGVVPAGDAKRSTWAETWRKRAARKLGVKTNTRSYTAFSDPRPMVTLYDGAKNRARARYYTLVGLVAATMIAAGAYWAGLRKNEETTKAQNYHISVLQNSLNDEQKKYDGLRTQLNSATATNGMWRHRAEYCERVLDERHER